MFPTEITLDKFISKNTLKEKYILHQTQYTEDDYFKNFYNYTKLSKEEIIKNFSALVGAEFIYRNQGYKITSVTSTKSENPTKSENNSFGSRWFSIRLTIKEHSNDKVIVLLERLKKVKEHLLVYADCIEEIGGQGVSDKVKNCIDTIQLEDLV